MTWFGRQADVVTVLAVDDVEQVACGLVPEAAVERVAHPRGRRVESQAVAAVAQSAVPVGEQAQGVVPESIDLDGFAAPRCDDPVVDLRVHPGQLKPRGALPQ